MNNDVSLLFGLGPLIIFVILDSFFSLKAGLIAAVVLSLAECAYSIYTFGELDWISITLLIVILIFAAIAWKKQSATMFKIGPFFVGIILSSIILISSYLGNPLILEMMIKYRKFLQPELLILIDTEMGRQFLRNANVTMGIFIFIHALIVYWAAIKLSNWWWLIIRGVGFYLSVFLAYILAYLITY